jgi:hypothetical protein
MNEMEISGSAFSALQRASPSIADKEYLYPEGMCQQINIKTTIPPSTLF